MKLLILAIAGVLALTSSGCSHGDSTPIARGEYYASGQADFDEFFVQVYRRQVESTAALNSESNARAKLAAALHIASDSQDSKFDLALSESATALKAAGIQGSLSRSAATQAPDSGAKLDLTGQPDAEQQALARSVEEAATLLFQVHDLASSSASRLEALRARALDLDRQVDTAFWKGGAGKRSEVHGNLTDARRALVLIGDTHRKLSTQTSDLLAILQKTFPANTQAPPVTETPPAKKRSRGSTRRGPYRPRPAAPATAAPSPAPAPAPAEKPAPAPAPKPAKGGDFEP